MFGNIKYVLGEGSLGWRGLLWEKKMRPSERQPRSAIEAWQHRKVGRLLRQMGRIPHWRELPVSGRPLRTGDDLREWLAHFPVLTKETIRRAGARMLAPEHSDRNIEWCVTGGSTGEPLRVLKDFSTRVATQAACLRGFRWQGVDPGDATVFVKGMGRISWLGKLRCLMQNFRLADPLNPDPADTAKILKLIQKFSPRCLIGYPTYLIKLAEMAADSGLHVPVIFSTGEMLFPAQRRKLETVFSARVAEYYGSNEVSGIAFECPRGHLHITEEHVLLETVDDCGNPVWDQPGRILVTDLDNQVMPLIRYELGDIGVLTREPCQCGRTLLVLKELQGRLQDYLQNARGNILPAMFFAELSRHLTSIRSYQLVQRTMDEILFRHVPNGPAAEEEAESIRAVIQIHLGREMRVTSEVCQEIALSAGVKMRLVMGLPLKTLQN